VGVEELQATTRLKVTKDSNKGINRRFLNIRFSSVGRDNYIYLRAIVETIAVRDFPRARAGLTERGYDEIRILLRDVLWMPKRNY
jgi:hypothetical protein